MISIANVYGVAGGDAILSRVGGALFPLHALYGVGVDPLSTLSNDHVFRAGGAHGVFLPDDDAQDGVQDEPVSTNPNTMGKFYVELVDCNSRYNCGLCESRDG